MLIAGPRVSNSFYIGNYDNFRMLHFKNFNCNSQTHFFIYGKILNLKIAKYQFSYKNL